jgi:hypothetical protein
MPRWAWLLVCVLLVLILIVVWSEHVSFHVH